MDVGFLFVNLLLTSLHETQTKSTKLCKKEHRSNCKWNWPHWICVVSSLYCNKVIECDELTTINIEKVYYGTNYNVNSYCSRVCNGVLWYSQPYTNSLMYFCKGKQVCELSQWNTQNYWRLHVNYDCKERYHPYTRIINTTSVKPRTEATITQVPNTRPQPPQTTTSSNVTRRVTESETDEDNSPDQFRVPALAASVTAGILVLVIVLVVVVCIKRRRATIKSNQPDKKTLQMQSVANNSYGILPPSVKTEDQQETDEHAYVEITLQNATNATDGTPGQEYVYNNAVKFVNKDNNDEYNTLNTHPAPFKMDPNYDHIPKGSHTTVDETYSHVTGGETTMPDTTYSHLKDTKSAASLISKINQSNIDNVYNHINTKSVEENVYNSSPTSFNRSPSSHLSETKAVEDDYDHTDWKQTNTNNSKSKNSNNKAVGKFETKNISALDKYAVVKKRSDKVESSDAHNYFVLEKQFFESK